MSTEPLEVCKADKELTEERSVQGVGLISSIGLVFNTLVMICS